MRATHYLLLLVASTFFMASCKKEKPEEIEEYIAELGQINFMNPEVGQKSHYVLFRGEDIRDSDNTNFTYLQDTLAVEIIAEDENGFLIKENLTPRSVSINGENNVAFADSTWYYYLQLNDGTVKIGKTGGQYRTRVFFLYDENTEGLQLTDITNPVTEVHGWKTDLPFTESYITAMVKNYEQFNVMYEHLNVVIDNRDMQQQGPGHTHIYSKEKGLVRSIQYSWWTGVGFGWDLLPF